MPSSRASRRLQDIVENARAIFRDTERISFAEFEGDRLVYDAVERRLERICEAVVKLGEQAPILLRDQPCEKFRSFGNVLRHGYDSIEEDRLFEIVRTDLPSLCSAAEEALRKLNLDTIP